MLKIRLHRSTTSPQVDVLESQFSQLLQQINSTRDFESIRLAHDHFLSNLLAQSFILLKPVRGPKTGIGVRV